MTHIDQKVFQKLPVAVNTVRIIEELMEIGPNKVCDSYLRQLLENIVEPFANASAKWQVLIHVFEGGQSVNLDDFPVVAAIMTWQNS